MFQGIPFERNRPAPLVADVERGNKKGSKRSGNKRGTKRRRRRLAAIEGPARPPRVRARRIARAEPAPLPDGSVSRV